MFQNDLLPDDMPFSKFLSVELYNTLCERTILLTDFRKVLDYRSGTVCKILLRSDLHGLTIPVEIQEFETGFRILLRGGTIAEETPLWRVMRIGVLPGYMNTKVGADGAYLLPVWSGVLVDFRPREHSADSERIYTEQRDWEKPSIFNCYGLLQDGRNTLAIVESGDFNCYVRSEFNRNGINSLYGEFVFRRNPYDSVSTEDRCISYHRIPGRADYGAFAVLYRKHLQDRGVGRLAERAENNPVLNYSADALRIKIFMADKKPSFDGASPVVVHTSCREAEEILDTMKKSGIERSVVTLVGWNLGGHDGAYPVHFPVEPSIGGEEALKHLIQHAAALGYQIVPHDNATDIRANTPEFESLAARVPGGGPVGGSLLCGGFTYRSCPTAYIRRSGYEFQRIRELGFNGHYYLDSQSTPLFRCDSPNHPADEKQFALALASITEIPRALYGAVSIENLTSYVLPFIDECGHLFCPEKNSDRYNLAPENFRRLDPYSVPFFHAAIHGLILYQNIWVHHYKDVHLEQLRELAFGARPCMEVSYRNNGGNGGDYRKSIELVKPAYDLCFNRLKLQTVPFDSFHEPVPGFYDTAYENGVRIRVNTTDSEFDGVPAKSWKLN